MTRGALKQARTLDRFEDNLGALDVTFNEEQCARLDRISGVDPGFPHAFLKLPMSRQVFVWWHRCAATVKHAHK